MEVYKKSIQFIDENLIFCLVPMILTLLLIEFVFKNRFETKKVLNLIRWIIIIYTLITITALLIGIAIEPEEYTFFDRATGPYAWAYWILFFCALILPLTLFFQKLGAKYWYVVLVALLIKTGIYYERFVLITTSFHRDYLTDTTYANLIEVFIVKIGISFIKGILLTVLLVGLFEILKSTNLKKLNQP